jgi:hypothetical protein
MKHLLKLSTLPILGLAFCVTLATADEPLDLSLTCGDQNAAPLVGQTEANCSEGMVTFRGDSFPDNVEVRVMSYPVGDLIDSAVYATTTNNLTFTQTLVPAGSYMVVVSESVEGVAGNALATKMITVAPLR